MLQHFAYDSVNKLWWIWGAKQNLFFVFQGNSLWVNARPVPRTDCPLGAGVA